jgi:integrating conjugative element protein (TIGR03758 family)
MSLMSTRQETAFAGANTGQTFDAADAQYLFIGLILTLLLLWVAWVAVSAYQQLRSPGVTASDAAGKVVRAVFVLTIALAITVLWT